MIEFLTVDSFINQITTKGFWGFGVFEQLIYSPFYANFFVYLIVTREKST